MRGWRDDPFSLRSSRGSRRSLPRSSSRLLPTRVGRNSRATCRPRCGFSWTARNAGELDPPGRWPRPARSLAADRCCSSRGTSPGRRPGRSVGSLPAPRTARPMWPRHTGRAERPSTWCSTIEAQQPFAPFPGDEPAHFRSGERPSFCARRLGPSWCPSRRSRIVRRASPTSRIRPTSNAPPFGGEPDRRGPTAKSRGLRSDGMGWLRPPGPQGAFGRQPARSRRSRDGTKGPDSDSSRGIRCSTPATRSPRTRRCSRPERVWNDAFRGLRRNRKPLIARDSPRKVDGRVFVLRRAVATQRPTANATLGRSGLPSIVRAFGPCGTSLRGVSSDPSQGSPVLHGQVRGGRFADERPRRSISRPGAGGRGRARTTRPRLRRPPWKSVEGS